MSAITTFILRFLIAFTPVVLSLLIVVNFQNYTKLELSLLCLFVAFAPWLLYELLQHTNHQQTANKALLHFCNSLEQVFSSVTALEHSSKAAPKEMISELKMLQNIMTQLVEEKTAVYSAEKTTGVPQDVDFHETSLKVVAEQPIENSNPQEAFTEAAVDVSAVDLGPTKPITREKLLEIIEKALNSDKIEMLVQPIVSLPQRKARHFECFARIKEDDGTVYTPDHFLHVAEEENLIRLVDNAMLFRCIQMTRASVLKKFDVNFFCNMSQHTLSDKFFFESLSEFLEGNRSIARHMIFEFHENAIAKHLDTIEPFLRKLNLFGCRFSIDQVTQLDLDVKRLADLQFKYIKCNSDSLVAFLHNSDGHDVIKAFKKKCDQQNMDLIISHVEEESALLLLNDFHFDYGQGFLFGCPVISKR